jgi:hypothetical protein
MVRNELSPQSNFSNHCIFTKTRPGAGFSQCELNPDSLPARDRCHFAFHWQEVRSSMDPSRPIRGGPGAMIRALCHGWQPMPL